LLKVAGIGCFATSKRQAIGQQMLVKTILNRCQRFKRFVYGKVRFVTQAGRDSLEVEMKPRKGSVALCSCCHQAAPCYDHASEPRRFEFVPLWGYAVFLVYVMRRVDCSRCGVKVEEVPWADGKHQCTKAYMQFLASWARSLSTKQRAFKYRGKSLPVEPVVEREVAHRI
jgi:transposase